MYLSFSLRQLTRNTAQKLLPSLTTVNIMASIFPCEQIPLAKSLHFLSYIAARSYPHERHHDISNRASRGCPDHPFHPAIETQYGAASMCRFDYSTGNASCRADTLRLCCSHRLAVLRRIACCPGTSFLYSLTYGLTEMSPCILAGGAEGFNASATSAALQVHGVFFGSSSNAVTAITSVHGYLG